MRFKSLDELSLYWILHPVFHFILYFYYNALFLIFIYFISLFSLPFSPKLLTYQRSVWIDYAEDWSILVNHFGMMASTLVRVTTFYEIRQSSVQTILGPCCWILDKHIVKVNEKVDIPSLLHFCPVVGMVSLTFYLSILRVRFFGLFCSPWLGLLSLLLLLHFYERLVRLLNFDCS